MQVNMAQKAFQQTGPVESRFGELDLLAHVLALGAHSPYYKNALGQLSRKRIQDFTILQRECTRVLESFRILYTPTTIQREERERKNALPEKGFIMTRDTLDTTLALTRGCRPWLGKLRHRPEHRGHARKTKHSDTTTTIFRGHGCIRGHTWI